MPWAVGDITSCNRVTMAADFLQAAKSGEISAAEFREPVVFRQLVNLPGMLSVITDALPLHVSFVRDALEVSVLNSSALVRSPESRVREEHQPDFADGVYDLESRSLHYKLFVPERTGGAPAPLLLMLHGCGQDAQDFSAGTQMNAIAQEAGMYVLYPSQSRSANANNCWNWFVPEHQTRDGGEPAALSTLTRFIMESHPVDPQQVFVAGLSAGGAMALILAEQYPELYSAVGVHSELPSGAASSMMEAFRLMSQSATGASLPDGLSNAVTDMSPRRKVSANSRSSTGNATTAGIHTPLIVFHGDNDRTVNCANAERIVGNWLERETARLGDVN